MWRRVPHCPEWHLSSLDIFQRTRFAGDGNISYVDCTREAQSRRLPCPQLFSLQLSLSHMFFPPHTLPLLATLHQVNIPSFTFTPLYFIYHCILSLLCSALTEGLEALLAKSLPVSLHCTYNISMHQADHCPVYFFLCNPLYASAYFTRTHFL